MKMKKGKYKCQTGGELKPLKNDPLDLLKSEQQPLDLTLKDNPLWRYLESMQPKQQTGPLGYNDFFNTFNSGLDLLRGAANAIQNFKSLKDERKQYLQAIQPRAYFNKDEEGLNNLESYFQNGGEADINSPEYKKYLLNLRKKFPEYSNYRISNTYNEYSGGGVHGMNMPNEVQQLINMAEFMKHNLPPESDRPSNNYRQDWQHFTGYTYNPDNALIMKNGGLTANKARKILHDGTVNGHPLTDKQRRFFGAKSKGNTMKYQVGGISDKEVELEKGEVFKDIFGNIKKVPESHDTHEEGGSDQPFVFKVLEDTADKRNDNDSKALNISSTELMDMFGIKSKRGVSHSKAFELVNEESKKNINKIQKNLKKSTDILDTTPSDVYAKNSLKFNFRQLDDVPTANDVFETLFNHQEMTKKKYSIDNDDSEKAQYGLSPYTGDKTWKGNASKYTADQWNAFAQKLGFTGKGNRAFQTFLFNMNGDNGTPNIQQDIINLHQKYGNPLPKTNQNRMENWLDNRLGHRWDAIYEKYNTPDVAQVPDYNSNEYGLDLTADFPKTKPSVNQTLNSPSGEVNPLVFKNQPKSGFYEPLRWYDLATSTKSYIDALGRIPAKYDGYNLVEPKAKYLNPLPALQEGRQSYNAAVDILPENGVGYGNLANLFAKKYGFDNKVIGDYANANNQIWNTNEQQVTSIRNQQQQADFQARQMFEQKQLQSLENQRQQLLRSMNDITTTFAQNAKLNREGNLLMKLFPNFNQYAEFNNRRYIFNKPQIKN